MPPGIRGWHLMALLVLATLLLPVQATACGRCGRDSDSRYHRAYWEGYRDGQRSIRYSRYDDDDYDDPPSYRETVRTTTTTRTYSRVYWESGVYINGPVVIVVRRARCRDD